VARADSTSGSATPWIRPVCRSAAVSLGKHEPPQPGPGRRKCCPMRTSAPIQRVTSSMWAPTRAHNRASELAYEIFTARKALLAYLATSALSGLIRSVAAPAPYTSLTTSAASSSSTPTITRSGLRKS
jgi:hypothetical protein